MIPDNPLLKKKTWVWVKDYYAKYGASAVYVN
jgi:hypothetical protein